VTRRKYATPEEAAAAKREQARMRRAIINQLIEQHKMAVQARNTEAAARARLAPPTPKETPQQMWSRLLLHDNTRSFIINALLREHYTELKAELDAYRLLLKDK
jgi:hypothetical protein